MTKFIQNTALVDSGPLVALFDKNDKHHHPVITFIKGFKGKLVSTTAVLTEVCHILDFSVQAQLNFLTWVKDNAVHLEDITKLDLERIIELTDKYADVPMDFADSTLVAIGERLKISQIVSLDSDFYIYRLKKKGMFTNILLDQN